VERRHRERQRHLLNGVEAWTYPNGQVQRRAEYKLGRKVGREMYYAADGRLIWEWQHAEDGRSGWTTYQPDGSKRSETTWMNMRRVE
jgi:antitoxin component YwqK of YwqJK toxin-antitoxin module